MTPFSRILIVFALLGVLSLPIEVFAQEQNTGSGEIATDTGAVLEMQRQEDEKWKIRKARTINFWANMMNQRKAANAHQEQQDIRRKKRTDKRVACAEDVRRANRDSKTSVTFNCFRATRTLDLEMLRKEKQFVETMAGPTSNYRSSALFHIENEMDAISTIVQAIDAGVYQTEEDLLEAKQNLHAAYTTNTRLATTRLRVDRAITWVIHLMVRMANIRTMHNPPPADVLTIIDDAIACLEDRESSLNALLDFESNEEIIRQFRQVQTELKFCNDLALEAKSLNTEFEQAEAKNEEL